MFADNLIVEKYNEWNKDLLLNHPRLWALRLPVLLGYFVVLNLLAVVICFAFPLRTYHVTSMFDWLWLFGVVELIPLGFWLWKFSQFSPEKELERTSPVNGMLEILLYMLCIFIFLSPTLTSSAILEFRFSRMITLPEIKAADNMFDYYGHSYYSYMENDEDIFHQNLVEKYTPYDYETYRSIRSSDMDRFKRINREMGAVIYNLINIKQREDHRWNGYLTTATILLHISVFMFAARHIRKGVFGKSIAYAIGIIVIAVIIQGIIPAFFFDYYSYSSRGMSTYEIVNYGMAFFIFAFTLFFSLRVFWQKKYQNFTALNITVLPYVVYFELFILFIYLLDETDFAAKLLDKWIDAFDKTFGGFWAPQIGLLIFGTPLLILPAYILIKAMYMRLLALPEG